ncbi:hypothetical protein FPZ12_029865 [Amycolatopsis acidicola]|uniref:Anti-sigma factor n=1 Tax=Amycolatopsis acidicola TaxID=2596893 RepID=A0A5N0UUZ4_9PSEU|nr:hypothetical protein [Amycolatopsis acidicola]KAA9155396.1 hypothetical protein FPZ12_029865 [Amycolatopsis acidicola]
MRTWRVGGALVIGAALMLSALGTPERHVQHAADPLTTLLSAEDLHAVSGGGEPVANLVISVSQGRGLLVPGPSTSPAPYQAWSVVNGIARPLGPLAGSLTIALSGVRQIVLTTGPGDSDHPTTPVVAWFSF